MRGNGGRASHAAMHKRRGDSRTWDGERITREGHYWMSRDKWREMWTVPCPACGGTGSVAESGNPLKRNPCYGCGWSGRVPKGQIK